MNTDKSAVKRTRCLVQRCNQPRIKGCNYCVVHVLETMEGNVSVETSVEAVLNHLLARIEALEQRVTVVADRAGVTGS